MNSTATAPPTPTTGERLAPTSFIFDRESLAAFLGINPRELTNGLSRGTIPQPDVVISQKIKRWRRSAIERWLAGEEASHAE